MNKDLPDENNYRFVAVLNKKIEIGKLMNALGHMAAGLGGGSGHAEQMRFLQYIDKNGGMHSNISHYPFIVLAADNANKIRSARSEAISKHILFTDFTSSMTIGTTEQQIEGTKEVAEMDLEYYGLCMFGKTDELREITRKFSLFS